MIEEIIAGIIGFISGVPLLSFIFNLVPLLIIVAFFLVVLVLTTQWLGLKPEFYEKLLKQPSVYIPTVIIVIIIMLIAQAGGLDLIMGRTNYTGPMGVPTQDITAEDLANPGILLAQPQVAGTILILIVFAVVTFMISQKK